MSPATPVRTQKPPSCCSGATPGSRARSKTTVSVPPQPITPAQSQSACEKAPTYTTAHLPPGRTQPSDFASTPTCRMRIDNMQPIKVAIVDDQQLIRSGLSMLINSRDDLRVTGEASNGQEALHSAHVRAADVDRKSVV